MAHVVVLTYSPSGYSLETYIDNKSKVNKNKYFIVKKIAYCEIYSGC